MINNKNVLEESLVNHLYFAGTIRSFCISIGLSFFKNNQGYINRAISLGYQATDIINLTIEYMNKEISKAVLDNDVYITPYTKDIYSLTEKLFDISLESQIDNDIKLLKESTNIEYNNDTMNKIDDLNNKSLKLIKDFKDFLNEIIDKIKKQELFSYLYLDFFNYMFEEISVYGRDIERILSEKDYTNYYLGEFTYYFNELLRKSALFIRGFLDTKYQEIFDMTSFYINSFTNLTEKYLKSDDNMVNLNIETERLVEKYKVFISDIIEKLLKSEISFITPAITLDNFLTNVNVYLFILKYTKNIVNK